MRRSDDHPWLCVIHGRPGGVEYVDRLLRRLPDTYSVWEMVGWDLNELKRIDPKVVVNLGAESMPFQWPDFDGDFEVVTIPFVPQAGRLSLCFSRQGRHVLTPLPADIGLMYKAKDWLDQAERMIWLAAGQTKPLFPE